MHLLFLLRRFAIFLHVWNNKAPQSFWSLKQSIGLSLELFRAPRDLRGLHLHKASSKTRATYGYCHTHALAPTCCTQRVGISAKAEQRFLQRRSSAKNHSCLKVKLYMHLILVTVITFSLTNISSLICGWQAMFQVCQSPDITRAVFWWYILIRFVECERWSCQHRFMAPLYMSENENIFRNDGVILTGDTNF